jgi:Skp family chaperone for outer membrane proteins
MIVMRGIVIAASLGVALTAGPVFAQAAAGKPAAGQAAPARPAAPAAPAQAPAAAPAPAPAPPVPFPEGTKYAFVSLQGIAQVSIEGKAAAGRVSALAQKKQTEAAEKAKALQANQQKLQTGGTVMSEPARTQLEKEIERQQREGERFEQDAQAELNELQQQLQAEFQKRLFPILDQLSKDKGLHVLFSAADAGVIWLAPGLDLTGEAVKRLDAATAAKAPAK